jgi:hypothetical protein
LLEEEMGRGRITDIISHLSQSLANTVNALILVSISVPSYCASLASFL